jgi:hypothetical protein
MPTELIEEVGVMATSAEDSQLGTHRGNCRSNRTEPPR